MVKKIDRFRNNYFFLSNFAPTCFYYEGILYTSVEAAFQAAKTLDVEEKKRIASYDPAEAKKAGRHVELRPDWESVKIDIMRDLLRLKFRNNDFGYRNLLLATEDAYLEEGNNHRDSFWGVYNGSGKNVLGKLLMEIREELSNE